MPKLTVGKITEALKKTAGNVSLAARALGVSRSSMYRHITDSPTLQEILRDAREELVDVAESALKQQVLEGNTAAIIFTLKTQGKERGYVERQEHEISGPGGGDIGVRFVDYREGLGEEDDEEE